MYILIILLQISVINSELSLNETLSEIKYILNNARHKKCVNCVTDSLFKNALSFFHRTEGIGDFLRTYNVTDCGGLETSSSYIQEHILDGLLIHHDVPDSHWQEYKVSFEFRITTVPINVYFVIYY